MKIRPIPWRRIIFGALIIAFLWLIITHEADIEALARTLAQGQWQWVLLAALLQVGYFVVFSASYQAAFYAVDIPRRLRELIPVTLGSIFVNVVAPTASTAGAALFVDDAARRGYSSVRSAAAMLLQMAADYSSLVVILLVGATVLFAQHDLQTYEVISSLVIVLLTGAFASVLVVGVWRPGVIRKLLAGVQGLANRLALRWGKEPWLAEGWSQEMAEEFTTASGIALRHPRRLLLIFLAALAAQLLDLATLYVLFVAFGHPVGLGVLVAGFAVGILLWIVSPVPQGIGVVEGGMALVYASLGVPMETATVVVLAFRGLTFWLPLVLGFVLIRHTGTFDKKAEVAAESWSVRIVALLTALMGIINVLSAVTPSLMWRLTVIQPYIPLTVRYGGHLTAALAGFALIMLSVGLWRRKRTAWLLTLIALLISASSHLVKGLDYEEAALALALAIWLASMRPHFFARSDEPSIRQGVKAVILSLVFTLFYGTAGFYLLDHQFSMEFNLGQAVRQTLIMFTQFYDPGLMPVPVTHFGQYFLNSIYAVGALTMAYALFMLLRPVLLREPATPEERARARAIVERYGHSSLARMTLFDDKAYFFSSGGSVIAYGASHGAAVALGDLIGPEEDIPAAIQEFRAFCAKNDWVPAFYQTLPDYLDAYSAARFKHIQIGSEAIVDLHAFTLEGRPNKKLRTVYRRFTSRGFEARVEQPPFDDDLMSELRSISDQWLDLHQGVEKHFTLGWFDEEYLQDGPLMIVYDAEGVPQAFANIIPEYQINECTIDLMRYRPVDINGLMDYLFVSLFLWAKEQGYDTFNLGLSPLAGIGEDAHSPQLEQAMRYIYNHVNIFYNFKGLHQYKEKFHPIWSPRYWVYPNEASLMKIALAMNALSSGGNFTDNYLRPAWEALRSRIRGKAGQEEAGA